LSLERVVAAAIATLDTEGESGLTLRRLAGELGSGVASLYWYADSREQLIGMVADEVLGDALAEYRTLLEADPAVVATRRGEEPFVAARETSAHTAAALARLRVLLLCMWDTLIAHPWLPAQLLRSEPDWPNSLLVWELIGEQLLEMELDQEQRFPASITLANFASGAAAEVAMREGPTASVRAEDDAEVAREMQEQIDEWTALDAEQYPFIHSILGAFGEHDDRTLFLSGLDLLLGGIERQTWSRR